MRKTQQGIALIETLLIVLILVIIGFGGYYVWHTQKENNKVTDDTLKASQSAPAPTSSAKYLTIKEWGVKLKLDNDSQDAYYTFDDGPTTYQQFININSRDFDKLTAYDGSSCKGDYIAKLARYKNTDPVLNENAPLGPVGDKTTIGGYTYFFATLKQYADPCVYDANQSEIPGNVAVYNKKKAAFSTMYDTIAAD